MLFALVFGKASAQQLNNLKAGPYKVGFKTILQSGPHSKPLLISLWYPASTDGAKMTLKDYIEAGALSKDDTDEKSLKDFKEVLELPFLYHLDKVPDDQYAQVLSMPFKAGRDAAPVNKKFPVVIAFASPDNYPVTFEYLASHGFVVAAMSAKYGQPPSDSLLYVKATDGLEYMLNYMIKQPNVDTGRVAAIGHGWGIQAPFYLAMRTDKVKLLVNLDGGVFSDRSKTTLSPDYKPAMLKATMLHIVAGSQQKEDNPENWKALSNPRYRVAIKSDDVRHHDFTMWGIVVAEALHKRGESTKVVEETFAGVNEVILRFLQDKKLDAAAVNSDLFDYSFTSH